MVVDFIWFKKIVMIGKLRSFRPEKFVISQHDKGFEPNGKMLARTSGMFAGLLLCILMFDMLFDWILGLADFVFELLHLVFELSEHCLELVLTHTLQTDHRQSEIIIANSAIIIGLLCFCYLIIVAPGLYTRIKRKFQLFCVNYLRRKLSTWHALLLVHKLQLATVYCLGIFLLFCCLTL